MLKVETILRAEDVTEVTKDLLALPARCHIALSQILFATRQTAHHEVFRGSRYAVPWKPRTRLEVVVAEDDLNAVLAVLAHVLAKYSQAQGADRMLLIGSFEGAVGLRERPDLSCSETDPLRTWVALEQLPRSG